MKSAFENLIDYSLCLLKTFLHQTDLTNPMLFQMLLKQHLTAKYYLIFHIRETNDNDNEVIRTTGIIETNKRYDAENRLIMIKNEHRFTGELIDEYSYRYDSNNNIIEEIKREPYKKKVETLDMTPLVESDRTGNQTKLHL